MTEATSLVNEAKYYLEKKKRRKFSKILANILAEKQDDLQEFCFLYGKLIQEDLTFALSECYYTFRKRASKIISLGQLLEMDHIIMNTYAFKPPETLIKSFRGRVKRLKGKFKGVLFLTDFRILGAGIMSEKGSSSSLGPRNLISLAVAIGKSIKENIRMNIKEGLRKRLGETFSESQLNLFQEVFPIFNAYRIQKSKNSIRYTIDFKYQKKNKTKEKSVVFTITPKKERNEKSKSFKKRKRSIIDTIEETLLTAQIV